MGAAFRYSVVDVFASRALEGNALAVFPDANGLDDRTMQDIARELNLSETTFVVPATRADCAARMRIFTPRREMPFAGHPTLGTAFVLANEGRFRGAARFSLEAQVGAIPIRIDGPESPTVWLRSPPVGEGRTFDAAFCAQALGRDPDDAIDVPPQVLSAGNPTLVVALKDEDAVDGASVDRGGYAALRQGFGEPLCVYVFTPTATGAYARMFAPEHGIPEDPASGSCMGPLAHFMRRHGMTAAADGARFVVEQGTRMGRRSLIHVRMLREGSANAVEVGGEVARVAEAVMTL